MKQTLMLIGILALATLFLNGCSAKNTAQKTEESVRDEIYMEREEMPSRSAAGARLYAPNSPALDKMEALNNYKLQRPETDKKKKVNPEDRDLGLGADKEQLGK